MMKTCYVGVKGIVKVGDSVLVLKKKTTELEYWDIPGGRIEESESLEDALRRELCEELPTLTEYTIGDVVSAHRLGHDLKDGNGLIFVFFLVRVANFDVKLTDEHSGYVWVNKENVESLLTEGLSIETNYYKAIIRAFFL